MHSATPGGQEQGALEIGGEEGDQEADIEDPRDGGGSIEAVAILSRLSERD